MDDRPALMDAGRALSEDAGLFIAATGDIMTAAIAQQALSVYRYELRADTPAKQWSECKATAPNVYRALKIDPEVPEAFYAGYPFRLGKYRDEWRILVAFPPPDLTSGMSNHLDIEDVLAWDPVKNTVEVMGDDNDAHLICSDYVDDTLKVYGNPLEFFFAWAEQRAIWRTKWIAARGKKWAHPAPERTKELPGALVIGDIKKIRWPLSDLPKKITCIGVNKVAVRSSIFESANIPRID
ncbi:MAG: hypothetical protein ABJM32_18140 [Parasphingorhabdus sp.]